MESQAGKGPRIESSQSRTPTPDSPLPTPGSGAQRSDKSEATVFVYGTLMRGQRNHERFCRGALKIEHATVRGQLYDLPYGFPALVVPEADVRGTGAMTCLTDAPTQHHAFPDLEAPSPGWDVVHGELMVFDDPERRLAALDALEGYVPGEEGLYERVLIPVAAAGEVILAWAYRVEKPAGLYLPGGRWPAS